MYTFQLNRFFSLIYCICTNCCDFFLGSIYSSQFGVLFSILHIQYACTVSSYLSLFFVLWNNFSTLCFLYECIFFQSKFHTNVHLTLSALLILLPHIFIFISGFCFFICFSFNPIIFFISSQQILTYDFQVLYPIVKSFLECYLGFCSKLFSEVCPSPESLRYFFCC